MNKMTREFLQGLLEAVKIVLDTYSDSQAGKDAIEALQGLRTAINKL